MTPRTLAMLRDVTVHRLAFAIRPVDHFLATPIGERLDVSVVGSDARPIAAAAGGARHADGTYRFADLPAGNYDIELSSPSGSWRTFAPTTIAAPAASQLPTDIEMWPTPLINDVRGFTVLRAVLVGAGVAGLQVELGDAPATFTGHFNRADAEGECVVIVPRAIPASDLGVHTLRARVDGGARPVVSVSIAGAPPIPGDTFSLAAGRTWRLAIQLGP
jgi:hypothetical protein